MFANSTTVNKISQIINITSDKVDLQLNIPINAKINTGNSNKNPTFSKVLFCNAIDKAKHEMPVTSIKSVMYANTLLLLVVLFLLSNIAAYIINTTLVIISAIPIYGPITKSNSIVKKNRYAIIGKINPSAMKCATPLCLITFAPQLPQNFAFSSNKQLHSLQFIQMPPTIKK